MTNDSHAWIWPLAEVAEGQIFTDLNYRPTSTPDLDIKYGRVKRYESVGDMLRDLESSEEKSP